MRLLAALLCLALPAAVLAADPAALAPKPETAKEAKTPKGAETLKNENQRTLYTLGFYLGTKATPLSITTAELKSVTMGFQDAVSGKKPLTDLETYGSKVNDLAMARTKKAREAAAEEERKLAQKRKDAEKPFLEKAAAEPGAQKAASGLIYTELKTGTGAQPTAEDTVKCHYEGKLVDGAVFDSSLKRGTPADFPLKGVIPCWTEGIQKLKVGGKARLVCPSDIAYGDEGRPPMIPGGSTLIFDVDLIDIVKPEKAAEKPSKN